MADTKVIETDAKVIADAKKAKLKKIIHTVIIIVIIAGLAFLFYKIAKK